MVPPTYKSVSTARPPGQCATMATPRQPCAKKALAHVPHPQSPEVSRPPAVRVMV